MDYSLPGSSWGFPGRSTGVGCHCLLRARILEWVISFSKACMHAKSLQSCLTLCDPTDSSPQDSLGKNTGVGCHFLFQCMKVKSESEVTQLCLTLCDPLDGNPPGSPITGILQARTLEWVAIWCWRRLLDYKEIKPVNPKGNQS